MRHLVRRMVNAAVASVLRAPTSGRTLLYHEIGEDGPWSLRLPLSLFAAQLDWLAERGMECTTATESREVPSALRVGVTFDDGLASAVPACQALLDRGWRATLFVVPAWIDAQRPAVLSWAELAGLSAAGVEVGAHGLAHERLCAQTAAAMTDTLRAARVRIEDRLSVAVRSLAYPEGLASAGARVAAKAAGFDAAYTTVPGANGPTTHPFLLHRNEVLRSDDRPALFVGKLAGSDDWFAPIRGVELAVRCWAEASSATMGR